MPEIVLEKLQSNMREEKTSFYSDGHKLDAAFFWPEKEPAADAPVFVINSGFTGLKHIHPERFSRFLTRAGYPCFGFDYRGFEKSEGEPKQVLIEEQVADIVNAVSYVMAHPKTKGREVVLMGWGMAGGLILDAARSLPQLKGVIALNGFYNARRVQVALRGEQKYQEFLQWLQDTRAKAATTGDVPEVDAFDIYPLDTVSREYVDAVLRKTDGYNEGTRVKLAFADSLLNFAPEKNLDHLATTPIFLGHGDQNALHPTAEADSLYRLYPGPKTLYWIPNAGHTEWMLDDNATFQTLVAEIEKWAAQLK